MKRFLLALFCLILAFAQGSQISTFRPKELASRYVYPEPTFSIIKSLDTANSSKSTANPTHLPEPSPSPTPIPEPEPAQVSILAVGDLMCLSAQLSAARKNKEYAFDYCFSEIKYKVSSADLAIANLETLVADGYKYTGPSPEKGNNKMNAPESFLSAVANCGFDVLINSNNHIYDRKIDGLTKTLKKIDEYRLYHTGAYVPEEYKDPLIINIKGVDIAILAYTDFVNSHPRDISDIVDIYNEDKVASDISYVKDSGADFIIVYMHWGKENTHRVRSSQKKEAAFLANAGADIILSSHPHCTQGSEFIETEHGKVPVIYSLGNLISSMGRTINKDSVMVKILLEKDYAKNTTTLSKLTYIPTLCSNTEAGRFVILPADLESIEKSEKPASLEKARKRTIKILSDDIFIPE